MCTCSNTNFHLIDQLILIRNSGASKLSSGFSIYFIHKESVIVTAIVSVFQYRRVSTAGCKPSAGGVDIRSWTFPHEPFIFSFPCSLTWPAYVSLSAWYLSSREACLSAQQLACLPSLSSLKEWKSENFSNLASCFSLCFLSSALVTVVSPTYSLTTQIYLLTAKGTKNLI